MCTACRQLERGLKLTELTPTGWKGYEGVGGDFTNVSVGKTEQRKRQWRTCFEQRSIVFDFILPNKSAMPGYNVHSADTCAQCFLQIADETLAAHVFDV